MRARCGSDVEIIVHSIDPQATTNLHSLKAVHRYSAGDVISSIRSADLVISGGGSLLQDVTSARSILYYLGIIRLSRILGRRVMIYGQGIGPIQGKLNRLLTRLELNKVNAITVRDEESRQTLYNLGVKHPTIEIVGDPSFAVEPASVESARTVLVSAGVKKEGMELLGVALRPWAGQEHWLPEVAEGIKGTVSQLQFQPVFLPMQLSMDQPVALDVIDKLALPATAFLDCKSPSMAKAVTGQLGVMVAMRLHALIFAASMGVPCVAISYDPKVEMFAKSAGMTTLDLNTLSAQKLKEAIIDTWQRRNDLGERARQCALKMTENAMRSADTACKLLG